MTREARTFFEGALRWAQASGVGGWVTASAPVTGLMGFVQAGVTFGSAQGYNTVSERGVPHHHKRAGTEPIEVTFTYLQAVTANMAKPATASGVSTPQAHFELRYTDEETPAATAQYFQFMNGVLLSRPWTEGEAGNQWTETWRFLTMTGPTGSGYLA